MVFRRRVRQVGTELEAIPLQFKCPASWKHMSGNDRVRHCTHCDRKVYNLSDMSRFEARTLMMREEGRLCVRYYLRPDGKVLTRDCGLAVRVRTRARVALGAMVGAIGFWLFPRPVAGVTHDPGFTQGDIGVATSAPAFNAIAPAITGKPLLKPKSGPVGEMGFLSGRTSVGEAHEP